MIATNRAVRQARSQVFASGHGITTPFYNRVESRAELKALFGDRENLGGTAIIIASPFGTGKTFFIETVGPEVGIRHRDSALRVPDLVPRMLKKAKTEVLFLDEADTKTTWGFLDKALALVGDDLDTSGRIALVLGDFALLNPGLLGRLPSHRFLTKFEPLDEAFLRGLVRGRLKRFIGEDKREVDDIITDELYEVLVPPGMAKVNSLRTVLAFLERIAEYLPPDEKRCEITLDMARTRAEADSDLEFSDVQEDFFFAFLEYLSEHHPDGTGLEDGIGKETMLTLGLAAGCRSWEQIVADIITPFGKNDLLLSRGTPALGPDREFVKYVEPYYPSLQLLFLAGA
jgi:hypothetical protein